MHLNSISIIIPVYNEEATILSVLSTVSEQDVLGLSKQIIISDDGSTDETCNLVEDFISQKKSNVELIKNSKNQGKGKAIQNALKYAKGDIILIQDADLEYSPSDYPDLIKPILEGKADVVYGSRFIGNKPHRVLMYWHFVANKLITFFTNIFTNLNLTDVTTCFKVFKKDLVDKIKIQSNGFEFETEITVKFSRIKDIKFYEVGISYFGRTYSEGKKIKAFDAFKMLYALLRFRFF